MRNIATIRLDHPATFNKFVQPIRLPSLSDYRTYELMEGTNVGSYSGSSKYVRNQVMANSDCHEQHPYEYIYAYNICTNSFLINYCLTVQPGSESNQFEQPEYKLVAAGKHPTVFRESLSSPDSSWGWSRALKMQFCALVVVLGVVVVVSAAASNVQPLPTMVLENLNQKIQPHVAVANNLSTYGYNAYPGQFPYHVRLLIQFGVDTSAAINAGSLITPNYVLTMKRDLKWNMELGDLHGNAFLGVDYGGSEEGEQQISFSESGVQLHPTYDIATIRLDHPAALSRFVQPIRLPRLTDTRTYELMEGTNVGRSRGPSLYVRNQVLSSVECGKQNPAVSYYSYNMCTNSYLGGAFCAGVYGSGLTVEDENGPILVGISISMYICEINLPTKYLRVTGLHDWISANSNYAYDL
uniref:Peptidase S1 domain-containing protein n=1 Tax=Anopheles culicifacies TaxID=139723 RepID=A0A182MJF4_9DIPT